MLLTPISLTALLTALSILSGASALPKHVFNPDTDSVGGVDFFAGTPQFACSGVEQGKVTHILDTSCIPLTPASNNMFIDWALNFTQLTVYDDATCGHEVNHYDKPPDVDSMPGKGTCVLLNGLKVASVKNTKAGGS